MHPVQVSRSLLPGMCNSGGNPTWPNMGDALGFNFTRNIVLIGDGPMTVSGQASSQRDVRRTHWAQNLYWAQNSTVVEWLRTQPVWPNETTLSEWTASPHTAKGRDASIIAQPGFVDAEHRNFKLKPESPAILHGFFVPFDLNAGAVSNPFDHKDL